MSTIKAILVVSILLTAVGVIIVGLLSETAGGWLIVAIGAVLFVLDLWGCLSWVRKDKAE